MKTVIIDPVETHLLRYDGMMLGLHQFTEVDKSRASYGASFYLKTRNPEAVSLRREEKRVEFEAGAKKRDLQSVHPS